MPRHPADDLRGGDGGPQPFWAHAEVDATRLDVITAVATALARRWVAEELAERFVLDVAGAALTVLTETGGSFDLWEEPGRVVCHVAGSGSGDATSPRPDPRRLRLVAGSTPPGGPEPGSGIVVDRGPGRVTLTLPVPFG